MSGQFHTPIRGLSDDPDVEYVVLDEGNGEAPQIWIHRKRSGCFEELPAAPIHPYESEIAA